LLIRDDATDCSRARGRQLNGSPRNRQMLRISDRTGENGVVALAKSGHREHQKK
jgi:hypothetical protein